MLEIDVNFLGKEEKVLSEIKTIPEEMIRILECLKTSKASGAGEVCARDEKHKNLSRYRLSCNRRRMLKDLKMVARDCEMVNY